MVNHQEDEINSHFSYQGIFRFCMKLTKETSRLEKIISTSKDIISSLVLKYKNMFKEIENLT